MDPLWQWTLDHGDWLVWLGLLSALFFMGSLLALPWIVARLPADQLLRLQHPAPIRHPPHTALTAAVGLMLRLAGVLMLVLPGQGLLTILLGLILLPIPGRRNLLLRLSRPAAVRHSLTWLRARAGSPPMRWPDPGDPEETQSGKSGADR